MKEKLIKKLTSRKFLVAVAAIVVGILGMFNSDQSIASNIANAATVLIPSIIYIVTEGKVDVASSKANTTEIVDAFKNFYDEINKCDQVSEEKSE